MPKGVYNILLSSPRRYCWIKLSPIVQYSPLLLWNSDLDRFSVPMWLTILLDQLGITDLVGLYPTNYLIPCKLNFLADLTPFHYKSISNSTKTNSYNVTHPCATQIKICVRLACVRHTASVHSEPESNSNYQSFRKNLKNLISKTLKKIKGKYNNKKQMERMGLEPITAVCKTAILTN